MRRFILNCDPSAGVQRDWTFADAVEAGVVSDAPARAEVDLRADAWPVRDQGTTGACGALIGGSRRHGQESARLRYGHAGPILR